MSKRVPISAAAAVAKAHGLAQVAIVGYDAKDSTTHVVTYGTDAEQCRQAAALGNLLKRALGWPEAQCNAAPRPLRGEEQVSPSTSGRDEAQLPRGSTNLAAAMRWLTDSQFAEVVLLTGALRADLLPGTCPLSQRVDDLLTKVHPARVRLCTMRVAPHLAGRLGV